MSKASAKRTTTEPRSGQARAARILDRIRTVPPGFVSTYGDIEPGAPRLVGRVLTMTNERVPWHRVVRADGAVTRGARQLELLRAEGVPLQGNRVLLRQARYEHGGWKA